MSVTHISAQDVTVDNRFMRQRRAWCGDVLLDYDLERVQTLIVPGQDPQPPAMWPPGRLIHHDGALWTVLPVETMVLPDDCCMLQHPDLTAT